MSLRLVGLGPSPHLTHLSRLAERRLRDAAAVLFESFTAPQGPWTRALQDLCAVPVEDAGTLDKIQRQALITRCDTNEVVLAVAGHPLLATPHLHLCQQAREAGVEARVVPGLSIVDVVAAQRGIDLLHAQVVAVENPQQPTQAEWSRIQVALQRRQTCVVLAAGRPGCDDPGRWATLNERYPEQGTLCSVDSDSACLVLYPT